MEPAERAFVHQQRPKRTFSQMATAGQASGEDDYISLDDLLLSPATLSASPRPSMTPPTVPHDVFTGMFSDDDGSDNDGRRVRRALDYPTAVPAPASRSGADGGAPIIDLTSDTSDSEGGPVATTAAATTTTGPTRSRRPSVSGRQAQRLPRFAREIIDLDDAYEPGPDVYTATDSANRSPSPDVQIVATRQLPNRNVQTRQPTPTLRRQDAQDVTFLETRRLPTPPPGARSAVRRRLPTPHATAAARRQQGRPVHLDRHWEMLQNQLMNDDLRVDWANGLRAFIGRVGQGMGIDLNYEQPAFNLADAGFVLVEQQGAGRDNAPPPEYVAPPKVGAGFTRSPEEDECLVCPNCGDELCEGEGEVKRQIWVVKKCGHVYCGECYNSRTAASRRKPKALAPGEKPRFSHCVVDGCGNSIARKNTMVQLYL